RIAHGMRNFENYRLRLLLHSGVKWNTRPTGCVEMAPESVEVMSMPGGPLRVCAVIDRMVGARLVAEESNRADKVA
ncbi:MAG: hypothetical protein ACRDYY_04620, partial [Acidimicrobiales bacterium]